jgi:hypothetical protein
MNPFAASVVFTLGALLVGIAWAAISGLALGKVAKRVHVPLVRPVICSILSYLFATVVYIFGIFLTGALAFVTDNILIAGVFAAWLYCLPVLAVVFNIRLLRSTSYAETPPRVSVSRVSSLVLMTQGTLFLLPLGALHLARNM